MKSSFELNGGTYRQVGDYRIPNITLSAKESRIRLGKWGMLHKDYLKKHKKVLFSTLLMQGKLYQHCAEVDEQATTMFFRLVEQMKINEGITEQLKEDNQIEWVVRMNNIESRVREIVCQELIYV